MNLVTVTFTAKQYDRFQELWNKAHESELACAELFNHDSTENINTFYQLPADALLDDMAEWHAATAIGFNVA